MAKRRRNPDTVYGDEPGLDKMERTFRRVMLDALGEKHYDGIDAGPKDIITITKAMIAENARDLAEIWYLQQDGAPLTVADAREYFHMFYPAVASMRKSPKESSAHWAPFANPRQVLLTAAIRKSIPPLYTYENTPASQVPIAVKFFSPYSNWTWYATEGEQQGDDFIFFGLVRGHETELGYFSLRELQSATGMGGRLPLVERDAHFGRHSLAEAQERQI